MRISIMIVLVLVGLVFAISVNTVSVFRGSHYVTDISGDGNDVNCTDCHTRIAQELYSNPNAPHYDLRCEDCHRFNGSGITFATANSSGAFPGKQAHAAYVPKCLDCHGKGVWLINRFGQPAYAPPARAFNLTPVPYYTAHKQLFEYCKQLGDENLACLACHTNYSVDMTFGYHWNIVFSSSSWTPSVTINGTRNYVVNVNKSSIFSGKHEFIPIKPVCKINCSKCHLNIYLGLINGKHAPIYYDSRWDYNTSTSTYENGWDFRRYHSLATSPSTLNVSWINNSYCYQCHYSVKVNLTTAAGIKLPPKTNPLTAASKGLVHCAEKVSCLTCHRNSTVWWLDPYYAFLNATRSSPSDAPDHEALINETANYPRFVHGDACMACHDASKHSSGCGSTCHVGYQSTYVYSEP